MMNTKTEKRKEEHIKICVENDVSSSVSTGFEDVFLVHRAVPDINKKDIELSCDFLGKKMNAPIIIEAMTGGTKTAKKINLNLAKAAEELGIAMGAGSQRAMVENAELNDTYQVRDAAPTIPLIGNLGLVQFVEGYTPKMAKDAVSKIGGDALALHFNPLQEAVQPEGDVNWKNSVEKLNEICQNIGVPVIAKEVGSGISREIAGLLEKAGVSVIDVAGTGGTSFSYVEHYRGSGMGNTFRNWGIPTAVSVVEARKGCKIPVIASGGIRNGIEAAKAITLGADYAGLALPLLKPALSSSVKVKACLEKFIEELRTAMFLTGANNLQDLQKADVVITGKTKEWLEARAIDTKEFANRKSISSFRKDVDGSLFRS